MENQLKQFVGFFFFVSTTFFFNLFKRLTVLQIANKLLKLELQEINEFISIMNCVTVLFSSFLENEVYILPRLNR